MSGLGHFVGSMGRGMGGGVKWGGVTVEALTKEHWRTGV